MRQRAIPKLSELSTAGRAELLAMWTAAIGKPPKFRASRETLGQRPGLATPTWTETITGARGFRSSRNP